LEKFRNFVTDFLCKIQNFRVNSQRVMTETLQSHESVKHY
jgi:hypothetical protein